MRDLQVFVNFSIALPQHLLVPHARVLARPIPQLRSRSRANDAAQVVDVVLSLRQ
jgi:hypothetical protein